MCKLVIHLEILGLRQFLSGKEFPSLTSEVNTCRMNEDLT